MVAAVSEAAARHLEWVTVGGTDYQPRIMTAGDVAVILPFLDRLQAMELAGSPDKLALARILPEALDAVASVLGCSRDKLDRLPLDESLRVLQQALESWLQVNGPYMSESVAPAVLALGRSLSAVSTAIRSPTAH